MLTRWLDAGLVVSYVFADLEFVSVEEKQLVQYLPILTSRLVINDIILCILQEVDHLENAFTKSSG